MYVIAVPTYGNYHTNNVGTFHLMREFLYQMGIEFNAFYDNGKKCEIRKDLFDCNRTFRNVDHRSLTSLAISLDMKDEMLKFVIDHGGKHHGKIVTH